MPPSLNTDAPALYLLPPPAAPTLDEAGEAARRKAHKKARKKARKAAREKADRESPAAFVRGVETMYRTSLQESVSHTQIADNKASIMTSINGVILSLLLAFSETILSAGPQVIAPCAALLATALGSASFSVLAAMPRVPSGRITAADLRHDRHNPLFFGAMAQVDQLEYADVLVEMCRDPERLYHNMSRNMHGLGSGLMRKFRLLRCAYLIFLVGITSSAALFLALAWARHGAV